MKVYKIRTEFGFFVPDKIYRKRAHAQAKITNIVKSKNRTNRARGRPQESGSGYEIVEYELVETMSIPYDQLKVRR